MTSLSFLAGTTVMLYRVFAFAKARQNLCCLIMRCVQSITSLSLLVDTTVVAKAPGSLCICQGSPEFLLLDNTMCTKISSREPFQTLVLLTQSSVKLYPNYQEKWNVTICQA